MLYPSIQQLTEDKINRYALVMGTAKSARHVTDLINKEREIAAANAAKEFKIDTEEETAYDKAVTIAIRRIHENKYTIKMPE